MDGFQAFGLRTKRDIVRGVTAESPRLQQAAAMAFNDILKKHPSVDRQLADIFETELVPNQCDHVTRVYSRH